MTHRSVLALTLLALSFGLTACGTTMEKYVDEKKSVGYSVTRGRIVIIEGLSSNKLEPLSDATAITVSQGQARVTLKFANEQMQVFDVLPGVVIVLGSEADSVLKPQTGIPATK